MTSKELSAEEMQPEGPSPQVDVTFGNMASLLCWGLFLQMLAIGLITTASFGLHFEGLDRLAVSFAGVSSLANFTGIVLVLPGLSRWHRWGLSGLAVVGAIAVLYLGMLIKEGLILPSYPIYNFISLFSQTAIVVTLGTAIRVCVFFLHCAPAKSHFHFSLRKLLLIISGIALLLGGARHIFPAMGWTSFETILIGAVHLLIVSGGGAIAGIIPLAATCWRSQRLRWGIVLFGVMLLIGVGFICQVLLEYANQGATQLTTCDWILYLEIQTVITTLGLGPLLFGGSSAALTAISWNQRNAIAIGLPLIGTAAALWMVDNGELGDYDYFPFSESLAMATISILAIVMTMNTGNGWVRVPVCLGLFAVGTLGYVWMSFTNAESGRVELWLAMALLQFFVVSAIHHGIRVWLRKEPASDQRFRLRVWTTILAFVLWLGGYLVLEDAWTLFNARIVLMGAAAAILPMIALEAQSPHIRRWALFATLPAAILLILTYYGTLVSASEVLIYRGRADAKMVAAAISGQTVILTIAILPLIWLPERGKEDGGEILKTADLQENP